MYILNQIPNATSNTFLNNSKPTQSTEYYLNHGNHDDPKFSDIYAWANNADPDQTALEGQSDQGLHCLPFRRHRLDSLLYARVTWFKF